MTLDFFTSNIKRFYNKAKVERGGGTTLSVK